MQASRRTVVLGLCATAAGLGRVEARTAGAPAPIPTAPPGLLLAGNAAPDVDPAAYLVSEKYDGVRALWDGQQLRHRSGNPIAAPAWFTSRLPDQPLDGELWMGRGRFERLVGTVRRRRPDDAEWQHVRYLVFDLPGAGGTFADRAQRLARLTSRTGWAALAAVVQERVSDRPALQRRFDAVVQAGGEGLMLHRADALWVAGRSDVLLKLKPFFDAEARVVGHRPGQGRLAGRLGALQVETPDGVRFFIGSGLPDAIRARPPAAGTLVTYRYHDRTALGVPRFAHFLRLHAAL